MPIQRDQPRPLDPVPGTGDGTPNPQGGLKQVARYEPEVYDPPLLAVDEVPLSDEEHLFVKHYLETLDISDASKLAGIDPSRGALIWRRKKVNKVIRRWVAKRAGRHLVVKPRVVHELAAMAFSNIRDLYEQAPDGERTVRYLHVKDMPAHVSAAISEIEHNEDGSIKKIKLHSKAQALDLMCKILGHYAPTKNELTGKNGGPIMVAAAANARYEDELDRVALDIIGDPAAGQ